MAMAITTSRLSFRASSLPSLTSITTTTTAAAWAKTNTIRAHGYAGARMAATVAQPEEPSLITRPLAEILRDMNKRVPDQVLKTRKDENNGVLLKYIPWYHANRMLSFYAPGWSGEVRSIVFSEASVSVVYRVTIRGSDGECWRESSGTAATTVGDSYGDPVQIAEGMAFRRACARFGLGLYLYHEDEVL